MEVPTPDMLESPLACLLLLAVKCPEIKTQVCEEILRRLMTIHSGDQLLCERCEYYLQRIAYVSARFSENREEEERKEKERERERVKRRNKLLLAAKKSSGSGSGSDGLTRKASERSTSRPKKEKREKKASTKTKDDKKSGGGETLKKTKKGESRTMRSKKKEKGDAADRATTLRPGSLLGAGSVENENDGGPSKAAPRSLAERVEDVRPYLDFSAFLPAETTVPFDHNSPGTLTAHAPPHTHTYHRTHAVVC
jgi:hypothetical protein